MNIDKNDTAVVFIDPQNEVLSQSGLARPSVHETLREKGTIANMERIFKAAKAHSFKFSSHRTILIPKPSAPSLKNAASRFRVRANARPKSARKISSAPRWSKCIAWPLNFSSASCATPGRQNRRELSRGPRTRPRVDLHASASAGRRRPATRCCAC